MIAEAPNETVWIAQPKQRAFLHDFDYVFEALMGGAVGGGKSDSLLIFNIARRVKYPGSAGLYLRRTYGELALSGGAIPRSHDLLDGTDAAWNGSEKRWRFKNGSVLEFGYMQHEDDRRRYHSSQFADIEFDELTSFNENMYLYMFSRMRTTIPGCEPKIRSGTNPGSVGHGFVKTRFIDSMPPLTATWFIRINDKDVPCDPHTPFSKSRVFVPSFLSDNPALTQGRPDYEASLMQMPQDDMRALLHGDWDAWSGAVFKRFDRARHVLKPFTVPANWPRRTGLDWGVQRPFVCLWAADGPRIDEALASELGAQADPSPLMPCDRLHRYIYREFCKTRLLDEEMAIAVATRSKGERIQMHCADPGSFFQQRDRTGERPDVVFARLGVPLTPANNDRIMGKRAMDASLADCACGVPRLRVFESCTELIRTLPSLPYDPVNVEDVDTAAEDDPYDCLVAGTLVLTNRGNVPIERIRSGDLVFTRSGYRRVVGSWLSSPDAPVLRVEMSDGRSITGTPNHRIPQDDGTYKTLNALRYGDIMHGVEEYERPTTWTPLLSPQRARISRARATTTAAVTSSVKAKCCTARSGARRTARSQTATTSTTSTGGRTITAWRIWCRCRRITTSRSTRLVHLVSSVRPGLAMRESMRQQEMRGSLASNEVRQPSLVGTRSRLARTSASSAVPNSLRETRAPRASVATTASQRGAGHLESITKLGSAKHATPRTASTATRRGGSAPVFVRGYSDAGRAAVYNLQVDGVHEYFANGILVSNSLRYLIMGPRPQAKPRYSTISGLHA